MSLVTPGISRSLAKILHIQLDGQRGSYHVPANGSTHSSIDLDMYVEEEPSVIEWFSSITPARRDWASYFTRLFPCVQWLPKYTMQWFLGDLIAGITVGFVVIPQGMAYAKLAELPPEFGLYSSFMGVLVYWLFATSKDITIGPVAVMSTMVGNVVLNAAKTLPEVEPWFIASAISLLAGSIVLTLGLLRLGWLVDIIPLTSISAFMTGSAITIITGQIPAMLGINPYFSTRDQAYKVIINIIRHIPKADVNAAMGVSALFLLYFIRYTCTALAVRYPSKQKTLFFLSTLRTVFIIVLFTFISWLVNRHHQDKPIFSILMTIPRGFRHIGVPKMNKEIAKEISSQLPALVIVLLIEHISIGKSFGRVNNYTIDPSQELVAIGVTNLLGPFLGAYPATGSFSRTAIKSKAGVRTPFAGVITAAVVFLAIYILTAIFFYIPNASLAAVIIHAVGDLITPPNTIYRFWRISPPEVPIFFAGVLVTIFSSIENGIYTTVITSAVLLLFRQFKAKGSFLGETSIRSAAENIYPRDAVSESRPLSPVKPPLLDQDFVNTSKSAKRNIFIPFDHSDGSNPWTEIETPYPGIFIYRFSQGFNYPNAHHYLDKMVSYIFKQTRRTDSATYDKPGDRPWNDPGPHGKQMDTNDTRPTLKAIILDFSSVDHVDVTSVQHLIDIRNQLDHYVAPDIVDWHFAHVHNRWTKRALASAGFGQTLPNAFGTSDTLLPHWTPIFSVAPMSGLDSCLAVLPAAQSINIGDIEIQIPNTSSNGTSNILDYHISNDNDDDDMSIDTSEKDTCISPQTPSSPYGTFLRHRSTGEHSTSGHSNADTPIDNHDHNSHHRRYVPVYGTNWPLFHADLTGALQSAVANVHGKTH